MKGGELIMVITDEDVKNERTKNSLSGKILKIIGEKYPNWALLKIICDSIMEQKEFVKKFFHTNLELKNKTFDEIEIKIQIIEKLNKLILKNLIKRKTIETPYGNDSVYKLKYEF